jgi:hypothetical protein
MLTKGKKALEDFRDAVIKDAKKNLRKKNVSSALSKSLEGNVEVHENSFTLQFLMEEYGYYQDRGVHGKTSSYVELGRYPTLARFGSGKGKKGGLSEGILKWVQRRRFQFRDNKGKFMSYKSTAFLISRSIWNKGLKPSLFFTKPFEKHFKKLPNELVDKFALDVEDLMAFSLDQKRFNT